MSQQVSFRSKKCGRRENSDLMGQDEPSLMFTTFTLKWRTTKSEFSFFHRTLSIVFLVFFARTRPKFLSEKRPMCCCSWLLHQGLWHEVYAWRRFFFLNTDLVCSTTNRRSYMLLLYDRSHRFWRQKATQESGQQLSVNRSHQVPAETNFDPSSLSMKITTITQEQTTPLTGWDPWPPAARSTR